MAYAPANMIPGIEPSPDKMLQVSQPPFFSCLTFALDKNFGTSPAWSSELMATNLYLKNPGQWVKHDNVLKTMCTEDLLDGEVFYTHRRRRPPLLPIAAGVASKGLWYL